MIWQLSIMAVGFVFFHKPCSAVLRFCVDLLTSAHRQGEEMLANVWSSLRRWFATERLPAPTQTLLGCLVCLLAIVLTYTNFGILSELIPEVFPFGGARGSTLALSLALSTCFVGCLVHLIRAPIARFLMGVVALLLVSLIGFLAYCGAAAIYNSKVLAIGGSASQWPLNQDIVVATVLALFCSLAELAGFWGGLHIAGSAIVRISLFPVSCAIYIPLVIARWFNRYEVGAILHRLIDAIDSVLASISVGVITGSRRLREYLKPESSHSRKILQLDRKMEIARRTSERKEQQQEHQRRLKALSQDNSLQSEMRDLEYRKRIDQANSKTEFQAKLKGLEQNMVFQLTAQVFKSLSVDVISAIPSNGLTPEADRLSQTDLSHHPQAMRASVYSRDRIARVS